MIDQEPSAARMPFPQEIAGGGVVLTLVPRQVFVEFGDTLSPAEFGAFLEQHRLQPVERASDIFPRRDVGEVPLRRGLLQRTAGEDTARLISEIRLDDRVRTASPVYHRADLLPADTATSFSEQVLVHFGPRAPEEEVSALIAASDTEVVITEPFARDGTLYQLRLRFPKRQDIFAIVDAFARSPLVRYAGPDWIQLQPPASTAPPSDEFFGNQWNLDRISALQGWDYTPGSLGVVIAIVDSGCDLNHPDLVNQYVPEADRFDVLTGTHTPNDVDEIGHGTLCAGVAAAQTDNKIGVAGVAPNCSIMPIRLYEGNGDHQAGIRSEANIVNAINWARTHRASVISMSWSYTGTHVLADIALEDAYKANIVLVAAAGNCFPHLRCTDPTFISYPATHSRVIAVGASDQNDHRQSLKSPDIPGMPKWDSRFGPQLSVMAPGLLCPTTKNGGGFARGRGPDGKVFDIGFIGTSAAAPHVAGLAALLLSWQPARREVGVFSPFPGLFFKNNLRNDEVRYLIEASAEKVGLDLFKYGRDISHPNGTWNPEMGYGRINLARALRLAEWRYDIWRRDILTVRILVGLIQDGSGVVFPPSGPPVPVDPGWLHLTPEKRDVLLGLAITELAEQVNDSETRQALGRAGWDAIEQTARRMRQDS